MRYKGAVFFDYDGTLTHAPSGVFEPPEGAKRAIAALREAGYLAILDTGRAKCYADRSGIEFDGMITSNGAHGVVSGEVVLDEPIRLEPLKRLMTRLNEMDIYYGIDNPEKCYCRDLNEASFSRWLATFGISPSIFRPIDAAPVGYKLSVLYHSMDEVDALRREFGAEFSFDCHHGYPCVDVSARNSGKGKGVKSVMEHFGIPRDKTYAFGDGENDYEMLKAAGHGIAMGQHAALLDEVAEFITLPVSENGIAAGLKHYNLI